MINWQTEELKDWLTDPLAGRFLFVMVVLLAIYLAARFLRQLIGRHVSDTDTRYRARKVVAFLAWLAVFLIVGVTFSEKLGSFTVALGIAGAGVAFALQEVITSIAGWIAVSAGNFYRPGDRIQLGGIRGDVIDISMLRTTLMEIGQWIGADLYNGRIVRIANSFVFKEPVFNYSADFPFVWDEIAFPVRYGSDWRLAQKVFQSVAEEVTGDYAIRSREAWKNVVRRYRIEEARIDPVVTLRPDENRIEYTIRYIVDHRSRMLTKDRLYARILEEIDRSEGRIRVATASFELLSAPGLEVRLSGNRSEEDEDRQG